MIEQVYYWCFGIALWNCGIVYAHTREQREHFLRRTFLCGIVYLVLGAVVNLLPLSGWMGIRLLYRILGFLALTGFHYICWDSSENGDT